uniref:Uncharacterized protein n=1 Tax=Corethron hystrix TaxID=216773 RepID=A0A7S1B9G6_9STRA|mmetsp:Transcript_18323/g.41914  ORF Transcript_18323/g.41914 Transcript_18323/m.41914 type:complete len:534 (+) Transcript_18323:402-2003(+)
MDRKDRKIKVCSYLSKYWKMPRHFIRKSVLLMIGLFVNAFVCLQKIDAQREFLLMLKTDCDGLKRKKEKLEKYVHELKSKGEATLSAVSYSLKEKRRQAQQEWENLEKAAFKKREKSETFVADLHRQAVKLLEPDLHNLLRKNETELENKKKGMRDEIARWKDVIEQKFERQLKEQESREKKRVEEQLSVIKLQAESDLKNLNLAKGRISESIQNDLTVQMERDRTSFDEEYRGQCKLHADQLNKLRSEESQKLDMIFKQHNKDMDLIHREQENAIWRQKELSAKQMERWKEQRTVQIRNEVRCEHDRELKSFEAKMKKDQQLAVEKIKDEEKKKKKIDNMLVEKSLAAFEKEQDNICRTMEEERDKLTNEWADSHEESLKLKNSLKNVQHSVVEIKQKLHQTKEELIKAETEYNENKKQHESSMKKMRNELEECSNFGCREIRLLSEELHSLKMKEKQFQKEERIKQLESLQEKNKKEIEDLSNHLIERTNEMKNAVEEKALFLQKQEDLNKAYEKEIRNFRNEVIDFKIDE